MRIAGIIAFICIGLEISAGGLMATLISDTFTDTNGTAIESHTPGTDDVGWGWYDWTGTWQIQSNAATVTTTLNNWGFALIQAGDPDIDITINFTTPSGDSAIAIVVRWGDENNHWRIQNQTTQNTLKLTDIVAGSQTERDTSAATMSASTTYSLRVVTSGNTIEAYWDGAGTPTVTYASATFQSNYPIIGIASFTGFGFSAIPISDITVTGDTLPTSQTEWQTDEALIGEHPIIRNDKLYVALWGNAKSGDSVAIYHPENGQLLSRTRFSTGDVLAAPAVTSGGRIFAWSSGGRLYEVSEYGEILQTSSGHFNVDFEALILDETNNRLLVPGASNNIQGRPISDITTADWTNSSITWFSTGQIAPPLINGSYIYIFDSNAVLWKLNLSDGTTVDSIDLSTETIDNQYANMIYDASRNDIYITDQDGRTVYSVDVSTSTLAENWNVTIGTTGGKVFRGGTYYNDVLYISANEAAGASTYQRSTLYALDVTNSGATLWTNTTAKDNNAAISNLLTDGSYVYAATYDYEDETYEKLLVIDTSDGSLTTSFDLATGSASAIPAAQEGHIIVGLWNDTGLQSIQARSGGGTGNYFWKADSNQTGYIGSFMSGDVIGVSSATPRRPAAVFFGTLSRI